MNLQKLLATSLLLLTAIAVPAVAQKRPAPAKPQPKPAAAPTPAPTFDNLLPADSYVIYGEVRDAGQLIRSSAINDLLEPILKMAGPPKEFRSVVKWLNEHAEQAMGSRLLFAVWPVNKSLPDTIFAIEFASPEDAARFVTPLNEFLPTILPAPQPEPSPKTANETKPPAPPKPNFHIERFGSFVVISARPLNMKQLRPAGGKLLSEDANFRTARNRLNSEPLFAYVDFRLMEKDEEEQRKQVEELRQKQSAEIKRAQAAAPEEANNPEEGARLEPLDADKNSPRIVVSTVQPPKDAPTPNTVSVGLDALASSLFGGQANFPEALGLSLSYEGESFDLRGLLIEAPGEKSPLIPFFPRVIAGGAIAPRAASVLPASTELFATMSLDLPQIYVEMSKPPKPEFTTYRDKVLLSGRVAFEPPFKALENKLQLNLKDDVLPLLGTEVAIGLPLKGMNALGLPGAQISIAKPEANDSDKPAGASGPIVAISVRDKDRLRALMPKLIDALGFKGASQFASTERREDTEIVSYVNLFAYAFVGDFLVLADDPATTRYVVDSYLKNETLASDINFKGYTRWQPQQVRGQFYVSPALMDSYRDWAMNPATRMNDQLRNLMTRLSVMPLPITYSLSNEGLGPMHELHLPKNLIAMFVAGMSGELNPSEQTKNERMAMGMMYMIARAEDEYKSKKGSGACGTLEDLVAANLIPKEFLGRSGYRFDVMPNGDKFEISAVPLDYGKSGVMSFFMDHGRVLRGGDRNGAPATASDPPIR